MSEDIRVTQAMNTLQRFLKELTETAYNGKKSPEEMNAYAESLWEGISHSEGLLQELAYYHDYGQILSKYEVAGYTLADVLVWQVDHFKLYMDRPEEMNRYRQQRLILESFETMIAMEKNPRTFVDKMTGETGQDIL